MTRAARLAARLLPWACLLSLSCQGKPASHVIVPGGKSGAPASASAAAAAATCVDPTRTGPRMLRRLSRFEYDNTIEDLLGVRPDAEKSFAADTVVNGFDDNAKALRVTPLLGDQLYTSAEQLAAQAVQKLDQLAPCAAKGGDQSCAEQLIRGFGRRLFRRPPTDVEVARYLDLYALGSADGGFSAGVQLVLTALLQSPSFLYRTELGSQVQPGRYALSQYELATELSYTLTGSTPDDALLDAADKGELASPEQLDAQAARLIDSPRGHQQLERFVREWLGLDVLGSVPKDAQIFPEWTPEIRAAMASEVDHFVEHVAFEGDGTLAQLLTAKLAFVNPALASFYGVPMPASPGADGFGAVPSPDPQRSGVLALGGVLTTYARPDSSSPVVRGKLVRERLLCQPLQPPPPGLVVQPPPVDPSLTVRQRFAAHSVKEPCKSCHSLIDPIGYAFEHFDGVGRFRTQDGGHPIDASGQIIDSVSTDSTFDGVPQLADVLAHSEEVTRCVALQWFRFAYGRSEDDALACELAQIQQSFVDSGGNLRDMVLAAIHTLHFTTRSQDPSDVGTPPPASAALPDAGAGSLSDPSAAGAGATQPAGPETPYMVHTDSSWQSGHCDSVTVQNPGSDVLDWSVKLTLDGKLTDHWSSVADGDSGEVTFTGADWNKSVAPGQTAQFGYCVSTAG